MATRTNIPQLMVLTSTYPRWRNDIEPPFVHELCRRLSAFKVYVIAPHTPGSASYEILDNVHVYRYRYAPEKWERLAYNGGIAANLTKSRWNYLLLPGFVLGQFFLAYRLARKHGIHLFHAHWMIPNGLIGIALRWLTPGKNHLLVTAHGGDVQQLKGKTFRFLRRWIAKKSDGISVVGKGLKQVAQEEKWPLHNLVVAPMGVDLQQLFVPKPCSNDNLTLVFAGRLVPGKGVTFLIEAMRKVVDRFPDSRLLIAGHGPLLSQLQEQATGLGLQHHVEFLGAYRLDTLPSIYQRGSIAVLPFTVSAGGASEGFGLTTIEAMGCGIPIIAGDVPAIRDILGDEEIGVITSPRDTDKLARDIIGLLADPQRRTDYAKNAREYALQRFDWDVAAQRYEKLLTVMR